MIYLIGNEQHANQIRHLLPKEVTHELLSTTSALDRAYGEHRNFMEVGGYSVVVDDAHDFPSLSSMVNIYHHPIEWAKQIEDYVVSLYLFNNDFSVVLFTPYAITPKAILNDLD